MKKKKIEMKFLLKSLAISSILMFSSINNAFAGHKNYHLKTTIDYGGFGLLYDIINDDGNGGSGTGSEYSEESHGYNFSIIKHYGNVSKDGYKNDGSHLFTNFMSGRETVESREAIYKDLQGTDPDTLVFSFPGLKNTHGYKATSNDFTRATQVGETLVTGLNQALLFIRNNTDANIVSRHSLHLLLAKLSYTSEASPYTITVGPQGNTTSFKISPASSSNSKDLIPILGLNYKDYVKIEVTSEGNNKGNYSFFPWKIEKGYYPNGYLSEHVGDTYTSKAENVDSQYLTWGQLILQAMLLSDTQGSTEQDFASDVQTIIGQGLGSDLTGTIASVRSLLGLSSMSELVLNMGSRPANYHLGVMSKDMHNIALTVYTLTLMISLTFVGFMIVKMLHQKMLSTTNVVAKTTLMEGIKDLAFVAIMLGFFAPLFEMLLELNYLIVRTFSYSSDYMQTFTALGNKSLSMESMAGFMVSSMFLSIDVYINFVYLVRAITVSFLFAISPIIIVSYLWSPAQKNLVFGFFRELVGNIFMQSFHAITMTFFSAYNMSNMSSIEALASAYCFVPITQLFRQLVLGNSGGFSEKIGGKLAGQVSSTVTGMQKSAMTAKHSKDMFTAQAKAQADIAQAEKNASGWSAFGNTVTTVATTAATGAVAGLVAGSATGPGAIATAVGGGAIGLISGVGTALFTGDKVADATAKATGELGSIQGAQADQTLGMGLAELGLGLGVSSFDGAGDRMVMSGLSTIQSGAMMKGQAESRMGEGGQYLGEAKEHAIEGRNTAQVISTVGHAVANGYKTYKDESTKEERQYQDMLMKKKNEERYNNEFAEQIEAQNQRRMSDNLNAQNKHMRDNKGLYEENAKLKMDVDVNAKFDKFEDDGYMDKFNELQQKTKMNSLSNDVMLGQNDEFKALKETSLSQAKTLSNNVELNELKNNSGTLETIAQLKGQISDNAKLHNMVHGNQQVQDAIGVASKEAQRRIEQQDFAKNGSSIINHNVNKNMQSSYEKEIAQSKLSSNAKYNEIKHENAVTNNINSAVAKEESRSMLLNDKNYVESKKANDVQEQIYKTQANNEYMNANKGLDMKNRQINYERNQEIKDINDPKNN